MNHLETTIAETLRSGDALPIRTGGLHDGALDRARSIRRRRRLTTVLTSAGLAAAVAVAAPNLWPHPADPDNAVPIAAPPAAPRPKPQLPTSLPGSPRTPGAAERPDSVGTDPRLLHFDVATAALGGKTLTWTSGRGFEGVSATGDNGTPAADVVIGTDAAAVDATRSWPMWSGRPGATRSRIETRGPAEQVSVNGRPATLEQTSNKPVGAQSWTLRWQPSDGLHALVQVFGTDRAAPARIVKAIHLDRAQRCVAPVRVGAVPDGWTLSACSTAVRNAAGRKWASSQLSWVTPGGTASAWLEDAAARNPRDLDAFTPNRTVAGHPAQWRTDSPRGLWIPHFGAAEVLVSDASERDSLTVAGSLTLAGDLRNPATWPQP